MTTTERHDYAWRLVLQGRASKAAEAWEAGTSERTIARMRAVKRTLGDRADVFTHWLEADSAARALAGRGQATDNSGGVVLQYARRLEREFGRRLREDPETLALVLVAYVGAALVPPLVAALRRHSEAGPERP